MKVLKPGHIYELQNFERDSTQQLLFVEKEPIEEGSTEMKMVVAGTTNEELLEVLLDRMNYLQTKFPCRENALAITNLEQGLLWLYRRTANRQKKGVEGKHLAH